MVYESVSVCVFIQQPCCHKVTEGLWCASNELQSSVLLFLDTLPSWRGSREEGKVKKEGNNKGRRDERRKRRTNEERMKERKRGREMFLFYEEEKYCKLNLK